jgi:hypothetical protein
MPVLSINKVPTSTGPRRRTEESDSGFTIRGGKKVKPAEEDVAGTHNLKDHCTRSPPIFQSPLLEIGRQKKSMTPSGHQDLPGLNPAALVPGGVWWIW